MRPSIRSLRPSAAGRAWGPAGWGCGAGAPATVALVLVGAASPGVLVLPAVSAAALATYLGVGVGMLEGWRAAVDLFAGAPRFVAWKAGVYLKLGDQSAAAPAAAAG